MSPRVAIVGGGITGLSAAFHLQRTAPDLDVTVYEAGARAGGKVRAATVDGVDLEVGADAFLVRDDDALALCRELGIEDDLIQPAVQGVDIWADGGAHPLPPGLVLGAPTRFGPLFRSGLLSGRGALRASLDLVVPREVDVDHESVAELIRHRFGREVLERLVDPLLSGIYAGDPERLGAAAATPRLADAARGQRSLARGLRADLGEASVGGSIFRSLRGGLNQLVRRLVEEVEVETRTPIRLVERAGGRYALRRAFGDPIEVDAVVLAVPAFAAGALLRDLAPEASDAMREIPYVSVASVLTVHEPDSVELSGSGMLVTHGASRAVKAVTYVSNKWPQLIRDDRVVLRSSVGRRDQPEPLDWDDDRLVDTVLEDLRDLVDIRRSPTAVEVTRWQRALPQYEPSHLDRLGRIDRAVATLPRLAVAGAAYRGVGVSACVRDGRLAAAQVAGEITSVPA